MRTRGAATLLTLLVAGAVWLSPGASAATVRAAQVPDPPASVAHRGNSSRAPENTLASIRRADSAGADMVEFDVNLTRDDVPVLMHDTYLGRTTDGRGKVELRKYSYVKALDAGSWFSPTFADEPVPTQYAAMKLSANRGLRMLIELKGAITRGEARRVAARWRSLDAFTTARATSFSRTNLERIKAADRRIRTGLITRDRIDPADARAYGRIVLVDKAVVGPAYVDRLHAAGLTVYAWTADTQSEWTDLSNAGVDVVITNRPSEYEAWAASG